MSPLHEVIHVESLGMRYGRVAALTDVTFTIQGPQVVGVLGPNGAGKTTLLELLEGLRRPTSGSVRLFGQPLSSARYPRQRVGVVLQREPLFDGVTASEYAELFAALYHVPDGGQRILEQAALGPRAQVAVERLSGGEAQRLFLAAAVVHKPELLFLDEPTAHLDPGNRAHIGEQIRQIGKRCTVLLCTHDLDEADKICDSAVFLVAGQVKAFGTCSELIAAIPEESCDAARGAPTSDRSSGRRGRSLEQAFFHHCAVSISAAGELG